ncbi:MAG: hypothetical protein R3C44_06670 [Chloroflexota bacterium]
MAGNSAPDPQEPLDPPVLLANWVTLLGTDSLTVFDEREALWQVHWRTGDNPDPATYHFFNHLIDSNETRLAQVDAPAFDGDQWWAGDVVVSRFVIPWLPEDGESPFAMQVGMYRYPELTAVPLLDEAANPYADALTIPLPE